jgi:adenine-specific DNA methylase
MIEDNFDISFVADLAHREKQIQQIYRPIIAVHKWFARRPGTLFRAILLSEFGSNSLLKEKFYKMNKLNGINIADPFMGGGTPLLESNRLGCNITGFDINPMAYWIVKQEIESIDLNSYRNAAANLRIHLDEQIGHLYLTKCSYCGSEDAISKYFLWVKVHICDQCGSEFSLFPGYLISEDRRHPMNVLVCGFCGELAEVSDLNNPGVCPSCGKYLVFKGPAKHSSCICPQCGANNKFSNIDRGAPRHRMFAIEYHCPACKEAHRGRFFKKPDSLDLRRYAEAEAYLNEIKPFFVPEEEIPPGDETDRLHRWGYKYYREMFNSRQLLGLELSCRIIDGQTDQKIKNALATNLSDLLRYQNMLCRYDTMALKSLDIFSIHGFPVGLIQCESNLLGIPNGSKKMNIGSGGWSNVIDKFIKAKSYCDSPFEILHLGGRKRTIYTKGEWIGESSANYPDEKRVVELYCRNAIESNLPPLSLDAVLTDPPYYGNVQYAELMDFCYVWLRQLINDLNPDFTSHTTRNLDELTKNANMCRGIEQFAQGISDVFQQMAKALKKGSPLVFTYHHNDLDAYLPIAVAILDSGLTCTASIPCPAEMGASIHIKGTKSSVIDSIFVCRSDDFLASRAIAISPKEISLLVEEDIAKLKGGKIKLTKGDILCIVYGHLIRLAIWFLRKNWNKDRSIQERLGCIRTWLQEREKLSAVEQCLREGNHIP